MTYIFTLNCPYLLSPQPSVLFSSRRNSLAQCSTSSLFSSLPLPFFRSSAFDLCSPTPFPTLDFNFHSHGIFFARKNVVECMWGKDFCFLQSSMIRWSIQTEPELLASGLSLWASSLPHTRSLLPFFYLVYFLKMISNFTPNLSFEHQMLTSVDFKVVWKQCQCFSWFSWRER